MKSTYPTSGDETDFLTWHCRTSDSGGLSDVLVVTTTMRMVNRVHSDTTSAGPVVTLGLVLVEGTTSLKERLVHSSTASDDTDGRTRAAADRLLRARRKLDARLVLVGSLTDDGRVVSGGAGEGTTVSWALLDVADDRTFGELGDREDVSDGEGCLLATVNESTSVETFGRDEGF